jgi:hypothetical protein
MHEDFAKDDPQACERVVRVRALHNNNNKIDPTNPMFMQDNISMIDSNIVPMAAIGRPPQSPSPTASKVLIASPLAQAAVVAAASSEQQQLPQSGISRVSPDPAGQMMVTTTAVVAADVSLYDQNDVSANSTIVTDDQEDEDEDSDDGIYFDLEPLPLYGGGGTFTPISPAFPNEKDYNYLDHNSRKEQQPHYPAGGASRLEQLWIKMTENPVDNYEPRSIQDMISKPNPWHSLCPTISPEQQAIIELMSPVSLPGIFCYFEMSYLAQIWGAILVAGHTIECICTNFGGKAWFYRDILGPLQHFAIDVLWNHTMISSFLLLGPSCFGPYCIPVCFIILPSNVLMAAINMGVYFDAFILQPNMKKSNDSTHAKVLQHRMGHHIRRFVLWYMLVAALLGFSFYEGNVITQVLAVFVYNLSPFVTELSLWCEFSTQLRSLPKKQKTVLSDKYLDYILRRRPSQCSNSIPCTQKKKLS